MPERDGRQPRAPETTSDTEPRSDSDSDADAEERAAEQDVLAALKQEPDRIANRALSIGRERLDRSNWDIFVTALIGGLEVSLGCLAAMTVVGAALTAVPGLGLYPALALGGLVFPVGFLFVIIGRSELFTENFLIPVIAVMQRQRTIRSLLVLWVLSWLGNVLACGAMALLLSIPEGIGKPILEGYRAYTAYKLAMPPMGLFVSAILAGMVMTALTWLLLALRGTLDRIVAIFAAGYLLYAANLSHSMVGAAALFVGFPLAGHSITDVFGWLGLATAGNLVGGVTLVTVFRFVQAREKVRSAS